MFIPIETTPNPNTLKFLVNTPTPIEQTCTFTRNDNYSDHILVNQIFELKEIESIFFGSDFIAISKFNSHEWNTNKLITIITNHIDNHGYILKLQKQETLDIENDIIIKQIIAVINEKIRPAVQNDGGDVEFKKFDNGVVYLLMHGACSGCPSATLTLKSGIENMLKHYIPEVESVEQI